MTGLSDEFETIQAFHYECGLVEGIGYRLDGHLVRYCAGSLHGPVIECEEIGVLEALRWWASQQVEEGLESGSCINAARARFLQSVADAVAV